MICFSMHGQMTKVANSCICLSQQLEYETFHSLCHELLADPSHWHMRHEKNIFKLISLLDTKLFALTSDIFLEEYYRTQCHSVVGLQITPGWRARSASFPRGVQWHAPPGNFENCNLLKGQKSLRFLLNMTKQLKLLASFLCNYACIYFFCCFSSILQDIHIVKYNWTNF